MRLRTPLMKKNSLALAAALALFGTLGTAPAVAATCTWIPASGSWTTTGNWSCGLVPGAADVAQLSFGQVANITGFQGATNLANAGTVNIANNSGLGLLGSNTNSGNLNLNSGGNLTDLSIHGVVSLLGSGSVNLSNSSANRIVANGVSQLTLGAGQTVQGSGQIGAGGTLELINNGLIQATSSNGLVIHTSSGVTNNNTLRANGGTLTLLNTSFAQGVAGVIEGLSGSTVVLNDSSITGGTLAGDVATASSAFANSLANVTNTGTLRLVNNSAITLNGTLTNNGTVLLQSGGNITDLVINGAQSILGTGTVQLSNASANRITGAGGTFTLGSGQTLQGSGTIGAGAAGFAMVNQGTVIASSSNGLLINAAGGVTNTGTLRADGGTLQLQTTVNSGGGNIEALNGAQVQLLNGAVINNANFAVSGAGSLVTTVGSAQVTLGGGTVNGPINLANNSGATLTGDLVYNGTLSLSSGGNLTDLRLSGARSISGTAVIELSNAFQNRLLAANASGDSLTLGSNITVRGGGQIGAAGTLALTNNGTIIANKSNPLLVETSGGVVNNGVMRADGGTLQFRNVNISSGSGSIEAVNGSLVQLLDGTVIGNATLLTSGAGSAIAVTSSQTATLAGGNLTGSLRLDNNSRLILAGDVVGNGTLSMVSGGNVTDLEVVGNRSLTGTLLVAMSNAANNRIVGTGADTLTTGGNVTLQGAGSIGAGTSLNLVNNGAWIANQSNAMTLRTLGSATNNNLIRADAATFQIAQTQLNQGASGVISAINGGQVSFIDGASVNGGTFAAASGGQLVVGSSQLIGIGNVNNTGTFSIQNNGNVELRGALANNGVLNLQSGGNATSLRADGNQAITGTGVINLSNATANTIRGVAAGDSLTLGSGQTLQGAGSIGAGQNFGFTNNGTVVGSFSNALTFDSTGAVTNNNQVRADAGTVIITGTNFSQGAGGVLGAINGGVVELIGGSVISGGQITTASGGQVRTRSGNTATLSNLTNIGTVNVVNNSDLILAGTVTNTGAINLTSAGNQTDLRISGLATLAGSGTTTLGNSTANRIVANAAGAQLTVGSGQTVQGAGMFGAGTAMSLVNQGTVTANQSSALTVAMSGTATNATGGLMQATSGTLNLSSPLINNGTLAANGGIVNASAGFSGSGTVLITGSGQMNVGAPSSTGTLTHNGSAASGLALGANNLTVNSDYTNANAGSGNSFNRRANVTGAGQILAGGDAAQVISGTGVTGGSGTNATLTIANVRVGANSYGVNIGNSGSSGPSLRGALQTSVNGANISDARLSGSGVTAGNYNAGGPGGAGSSQTITFTAASAGALAPLTGQVVNLRSTFDNIADQKLNIVLAGGAAAYNAAIGSAAPSPVVVGNQRVGGSGSAALTISNTAAAGAFTEDLRASFAANTGAATNNGAVVNNLLAGTSNGSAMAVGVDTASAGAKSGSVTVNYQTTGTVAGVSNGLGLAGANAPQVVAVSGNVYQAASGALQTAPLNFGTIQVGQTVSQGLVVRNTATGAAGFVEDLNASFGASGNAQISGAGSLSGILAGNNSTAGNGTMTVTVNATTAGALNSSIAVNYFSAGAVAGVSNGLGTLAVGSEGYGVSGLIETTGSVINQASPLVNTPTINLGSVRVGAAAPSGAVSVTNFATAAPQAALNASFGGTTGPVAASGSFNLLDPGATNNSSLVVALNTATAGNFTGGNAGTATINFVSDASNVGGCAPSCTLSLASQQVNVEGKVYTQAVGALATAAVNFGVVRVGDTVAASNITVNNTATATALNDTLRADLSGLGGPFSGNGALSDIVAQGNGQLAVGLSTTTAGIFSQTGTVGFTSQNADMADVSAGADANLSVFAQVNNLANGDFDLLSGSGTLTQTGTSYELDLGTLVLGSTVSSTLQLDNETTGPSDDLSGIFDLLAADDFGYSGWSPVSGLAAGMASGAFSVNWMAGALGSYSDTIVFHGLGTNASDSVGLAQTRTLTIRASVIDAGGPPGAVPVPGTLPLLLAAGVAAWAVRRRTGAAGAAR